MYFIINAVIGSCTMCVIPTGMYFWLSEYVETNSQQKNEENENECVEKKEIRQMHDEYASSLNAVYSNGFFFPSISNTR